jgi:hypothetical protein
LPRYHCSENALLGVPGGREAYRLRSVNQSQQEPASTGRFVGGGGCAHGIAVRYVEAGIGALAVAAVLALLAVPEPYSTTEWIEVGALRKRAVTAEGLRAAIAGQRPGCIGEPVGFVRRRLAVEVLECANGGKLPPEVC